MSKDLDGEQLDGKISSGLSNSLSSKSGKSFPALHRVTGSAVRSPGRSHDDLDLIAETKSSISLTASTSMPNLAELGAGIAPDVMFWQDLDLPSDFFDQQETEHSPKKAKGSDPPNVADSHFEITNSASKGRRPPKVDREHFFQSHSNSSGRNGVASLTSSHSGSATKSSSSMSMSISSASNAKMDISSASLSEGGGLGNSSISMSMSIDSRDTMTNLARRIEPVMHDNIEFAPLDMTPGEEMNLRRSSSYTMSTDERLVKYTSASNQTTPSVQKTFDFYPESISMSMSSWSQHTISQDVFSHHNVVRESSFNNEHALDSELWPVPSVDLDLLGSLDSYAAGPGLALNHNQSFMHSNSANDINNNINTNSNQPASTHSNLHSAKNHLPPTHSNSNHNINPSNNSARGSSGTNNTSKPKNNVSSVSGVAQPQQKNTQKRQSLPPAAPPAPKASPKARGPVRGRGNLKINVEKSSVTEKAGAKEASPVLSPRGLEKGSSAPNGNPINRFGLTIDVPPAPQASPQLTHMPVMMQGHPMHLPTEGMYAFPTSFPQHPHGHAVPTNSPSSPRNTSKQLSPTNFMHAPMAPLYDPLTGVVYYPQMVGTMPPGAMYSDPNSMFFAQQMQAMPGVSPRAAAVGNFPYQGSAYAFPSSYSPVSGPDGTNTFESTISATIMNHGSTSTTVTPTGSSVNKKDKKDKNRGNYRCGRCGKPKVNHVCAFIDAITVSQAVQANGSILNPVTRQPYSTDRVITVNTKRKSIHDDKFTANDIETFKSLGMKTASDSFTLGSKTHLYSNSTSSSTALGSLSTKSGGSLLGETLFVRTHSETFDSLSRSGDEAPGRALEVTLHTARSPVGSSAGSGSHLKHSVAFDPPSGAPNSGQEHNNQEQSKPAGTPRGVVLGLLSCASDDAEDAFFPTEYPPNNNPKDRDGFLSSRNSTSTVASNDGNGSDTSSANGDAIPAAAARPAKRGSLFSTDLGLSKFFQF